MNEIERERERERERESNSIASSVACIAEDGRELRPKGEEE